MSKQLFTKRFYTNRGSRPCDTTLLEQALADFVNRNNLGLEEVTIIGTTGIKGKPCLLLFYWAQEKMK